MREPLRLTLTTPPARLPVELNELRAQLRLDDDQVLEDALLAANLRSAVQACESFTGRAVMTQTWTLFRDAWPAHALTLPRPPLRSVVHVKTYSESDTESLWAAENYIVDTASLPGRLIARVGQVFPVPGRAANGIEVRFTAGHGDTPMEVPEQLRQGILRLATHLFENRGDIDLGDVIATSGAAALWRPFVVARL
jgi:uncharacterized phiE125 gp8 family phage protein